jgi:superoxide dismutase, Fe-Mn family
MALSHEAKNYDHLVGGKLKGFSDTQIKAHLTLYQGYVKKLNEIWGAIAGADKTHPNYSFDAYSELRRREPVAYNGTYLHELYFDALGVSGDVSADLKTAITQSFGSYDAWIQDFKAIGGSGHGWVQLVWDPANKVVANSFIQSEHHVGLLTGVQPLLVMDVWEHAYFFDFQTRKPDYMTAFLENVSWKHVNERFSGARKG